jgi:hypothetical protein
VTGQDEPAAPERVLAVGGYELWFIAQLTFGLVYLGGAMFLLPPFVLSLRGSTPGDVNVVMAVLPLIALGAPIVAGLLERFQSSGGQGAFAFAEGAAAVAGAFIAGWVASEFGYAQVALVVILGAGAATGLALLLPTARADKESEGVAT